jgi:hypothetical protein
MPLCLNLAHDHLAPAGTTDGPCPRVAKRRPGLQIRQILVRVVVVAALLVLASLNVAELAIGYGIVPRSLVVADQRQRLH